VLPEGGRYLGVCEGVMDMQFANYWFFQFSIESSRTSHYACVASFLAAIKHCGTNWQQS